MAKGRTTIESRGAFAPCGALSVKSSPVVGVAASVGGAAGGVDVEDAAAIYRVCRSAGDRPPLSVAVSRRIVDESPDWPAAG